MHIYSAASKATQSPDIWAKITGIAICSGLAICLITGSAYVVLSIMYTSMCYVVLYPCMQGHGIRESKYTYTCYILHILYIIYISYYIFYTIYTIYHILKDWPDTCPSETEQVPLYLTTSNKIGLIYSIY